MGRSCLGESTPTMLTGSFYLTSPGSCRLPSRRSTSGSSALQHAQSDSLRLIQRIMERTAYTGGGPDPYFGTVYPEFLISEYDELPTLIATRGHEIDDDAYIGAIRSVIEDLASSGNVVIVGRGAHIILKDNPAVLRVGLIATVRGQGRTRNGTGAYEPG